MGSHQLRRWTEGIRAGSEEAFNGFYEEYADRLHRYLIVIEPRDESLTREAMQETLLRVLRYVKPCADERVFWSWLTRVARTALIDIWRQRGRRAHHEQPLETAPPLAAERGDEAEAHLLDALRAGLDGLAPGDRRLIEEHYLEGRSQRSLADEHGTTVKAIESRLARLRMRLRVAMLKQLEDDDGDVAERAGR